MQPRESPVPCGNYRCQRKHWNLKFCSQACADEVADMEQRMRTMRGTNHKEMKS